MRVFVTGGTGFAGSHLIEALLADGHELFGLVHAASSHQPAPLHDRFELIQGDLLDLPALKVAMARARPELIFHLAGQASPSRSWENPAWTFAINTGGTANVLEAALTVGKPRVVVVTSAIIYGVLDPDMLPITEDSYPRPDNPYGISKWSAGQLALLYWRRYGLPVVEARPFNHIGPRQTLGFVVPDLASQIAAIKLGKRKPVIEVGNLSSERDFTDVRDVSKAYLLLAEVGEPGHYYLICSGKAHTIEYLLKTLIELAGITVSVIQDPNRMRPSETPRVVGSYTKLKRDTGWRPSIDIRQSLADTLDDWLTRVQNE